MKKKANQKRKKKDFKQRFEKIYSFFEKRPIVAFTALTLLLMIGVFLMERGSEWFKASILEAPKFDGTVMPVKKIPNWKKGFGKNTKKYSQYAAGDLINFPRYDINQLRSNKEDNATVNAKITYPVVYMGNYKNDHLQGAGSHLAIDIKLPIGTPIYNIANGKVIKVKLSNSGFGNHLCVEHSNVPVNGKNETIYACYNHLEKILVKEGQIIKKDVQIATSGESGTSTTPHLHFQIDRSTAPWHPWWPFTSSQALAANLSFFQAINTGLGKNEAQKNTINPMEWVQANLNATSSTSTSATTNNATQKDPVEKKKVFKEFEIKGDKNKLKIKEKLIITIKALDEEGKIFEEINKEEVKLLSNDKSLNLPEAKFEKGIAKIEVTFQTAGNKNIVVKKDKIMKTLKIIVEEDSAAKENKEDDDKKENNNVSPENSNDEKQDENEDNTHAAASTASVHSFAIRFNEDNFNVGVASKIFIDKLDQDEQKTQKSFKGTAKLTLLQGKGSFSKEKIESKDFNENGTAEITFTPKNNDKIKIKIQSGVLIGESERIAVKEKVKLLFSDVPVSHPFYEAITSLKKKGIIDGFSDGTFKPNNNITRVATIKMLLLGLKINIISGQIAFADTSNNQWYKDYLFTSVENKIVNGFPDNTFKPANNINRAEFFKILLKTAKVNVPTTPLEKDPFNDVPKNAWFAGYAKYAKDKGLLNFKNNKFEGEKLMNRGEISYALDKLIE